MDVTIKQLAPALRRDFYEVMHRGTAESAECLCTAYQVSDWSDESARAAFRNGIFESGRSDGYLMYVGGIPAGWCQCAPLESFAGLAGKQVEPGTWAITCMVLLPEWRGKGMAHHMFQLVLENLRRRGANRVRAYGHRLGPDYSSPLDELPERVCTRAGMTLERDHPECPVYSLRLE